jgi:hypothetical protein
MLPNWKGNSLGTGTGSNSTISCAASTIGGREGLFTVVSSSTGFGGTFLFSDEWPESSFTPAENFESKEVMPVELFLGVSLLPLFPLVSPLVDEDTSGVISATPLSKLPKLGLFFGWDLRTTVGGAEFLTKDMETFFASSFARSVLGLADGVA